MDYIRSLNKKQVLTFIIVTISIVVLIWIIFPYIRSYWKGMDVVDRPEMFNENAMGHPEKQPTELPFVGTKVGSLINGPGNEVGETGEIYQPATAMIPSNYYFLDDGDDGRKSIQHNLCSKSCCVDQWPTPFKMKHDPYVCQNKDKFVPSRIMCNNNFQDAGCLCLTKEQAKFIYNRGGNGREWF